MRCLAVLVFPGVAWAAFRRDHAFLSADSFMQPAVVARTLSHVEDEWKVRARAFIECELSEDKEGVIRDCDDTPSDFSKSCSTVVSAVVQGSSGNLATMREYMGNVCNQAIMTGWHQTSCVAIANTIGSKMSASRYDNRVNFQTSAVCDDFWSSFLAEQKTLHQKELVAIKEREKKDLEVAAKEAKKAEQRSARAQKDLEEAEHGDNAKEEAELAAERKMVASRANRTTAAVDKNFEAKEAEVKAVEDAAEKKIEEATKLEEEPLTTATKADTVVPSSENAAKVPTAPAKTTKEDEKAYEKLSKLLKEDLAEDDVPKPAQLAVAASAKTNSTSTVVSKALGAAQPNK